MPVLRPTERRRHLATPLAAFLILGLASPGQAAQLETALRSASDLALAAVDRLNERIEDIRDPDVTELSRVDLDLRIDRIQADRSLEPFLAAPAPDLPALAWDKAFDWRPAPSGELEVRRQTASDGTGDLWGRGVIEFGRERDGMIASHRSRADLATGLDLSLSTRSTAGLAAGLNRSHDDGTGTLDLPSISAYGTFAPTPESFVDLAAGVGLLHASASAAASTLSSGVAGFASATYGARYKAGAVVLSPYGRFETTAIRGRSAPATASGATFAMRNSAVAGLRTTRPIRRADRTLAPALRLEVRQDLARASSLGHRASQEFTLAPEIAAELAPHWTARVEHLSRFGGDGDTRSLQLRLEAKF